MITALRRLALEVKDLDRAVAFYRDHLALPTVRESDGEVAFRVGGSALVLRRPSTVPRGGLHTHYALSAPAGTYDAWYDRLSASFDLHEHSFGDTRSLYCYDTEGNCVEIGASRNPDEPSATSGPATASEANTEDEPGSPPPLTGIFEVVLEVEDLDRAAAFYTALGFEVVDRGTDRKRVRLTAGPFDLELWEPHLGIADARGGVHVALGLAVEDPEELAAQVRARARGVETLDEGYRVCDPDGHYLALRSA